MPGGAFEASPEFDWDPIRTAEEIQRAGGETLEWLRRLALDPVPIDYRLVCAIHRHWFDTTFPAEAGERRMKDVLNRKNTAEPYESILPSVVQACGNFAWRLENCLPGSEDEQVAFLVAETNTLAVAVYDIHPFIDGNTRASWHLRNYALMAHRLRPLVDYTDRYEQAWWRSSPLAHEDLDYAVLEILAVEDRP